MSIWGKVRARAEELLGRAEEVYGQSHGDTAATAAGEAHRLEAEAEERRAGRRGAREHHGEDSAPADPATP